MNGARDRERVRHCIEGEEAAWRELVTAHGGGLVRTVRRTLARFNAPRSDADVHDLCAGAWMRLLEKNRRLLKEYLLKNDIPFSAWLKGIAVYVVREKARSEARRFRRLERYFRMLEPMESPPSPSEFTAQDADRLERLMSRLPERDRLLIRLGILEELPYDRIAPLLEEKTSSIGSLLFRAKERLRELYRESDSSREK